jgi:Gas vesicle synthesis protein GvpO
VADKQATQQDGPDGQRAVPAKIAARRAAEYVGDFTGRNPECVISVDRADGGWKVGVEVVEIRRIPDTTDVLAIYEVCLDHGGHLLSYRRTRRYARGQLDERCR